MRYKYETRSIVLARSPLGEANASVTLLTQELGLVRARAQGVRARGAKLAPALATLVESSATLVHGREGWRIAGAVLEENWFERLRLAPPRTRASRVCSLLLRLAAEDARDHGLFLVMRGFFEALVEFPEDTHEAAEVLAALRMLSMLGLDVGEIPGEASSFTRPLLSETMKRRSAYIARINHGIAASGL